MGFAQSKGSKSTIKEIPDNLGTSTMPNMINNADRKCISAVIIIIAQFMYVFTSLH